MTVLSRGQPSVAYFFVTIMLVQLGRQGTNAWLSNGVAKLSLPGTQNHHAKAAVSVGRLFSWTAAADDTVKVPAKFVSYPFGYRQEIEIRIDTLTNRGWGIGRLPLDPELLSVVNEESTDVEQEEGSTSKWVIMVPNVVPGELVKVAIFRNFKSYSEADLVEILEPSADRVEPLCPLAQECGGCQLQHMSIEAQRHWKTVSVEEGLAQYGLSAKVEPALGTDEIYGYRSKLTPHFQAPSRRKRGVSKPGPASIDAIGFQKQTSRQIIDVPSCPIATPPINNRYASLRYELLSQPTDRKKGATLLLRQGNLQDEDVTTDHKSFLTTTVRGLNFQYLAGNFFQNNLHVVPLMVDHVVEQAVGGGGMTHLADCYCGSGLFAVSAAAHFDTCVGIEINDKAVEEATANAARNNITNCMFVASKAEGIFDEIQDFPRDTTAVVLDPPRKGCSPEFLQQLYEFRPRRIVYMSCDPTTQARDAEGIVGAGYSIVTVQPFDLFPQTRHIECLMILERNDV
jgi:23S rRNA (uracil1939-C5)-methyltransferase/tRNA (uracil-5-)-methyltransferase